MLLAFTKAGINERKVWLETTLIRRIEEADGLPTQPTFIWQQDSDEAIVVRESVEEVIKRIQDAGTSQP